MTALLIGLGIWFGLGWLAGKACYRDAGQGGLAFLIFIMGVLGYFVAWCAAPRAMADVHGLSWAWKAIPFTNSNISVAKFFAEKEQ